MKMIRAHTEEDKAARWDAALRKESGFTLLELMVVIAILILLAGIAAPRLFDSFEQARIQKLEIDAKQILAAVNRQQLNAWMQGDTERDKDLQIELNEEELFSTYGLEISIEKNATYRYHWQAAERTSWVEISYNGQTYRTDLDSWQKNAAQ